MTHNAVLFDLDGTLADTLEDLALSMNESLASLGLPVHPVAAYRHFVGDGMTVLCQRVLPADRQGLVERLTEVMRTHYARRYMDHTRLYPGMRELIETLSRRGTPMAVLSNKPDDFTVLMVEKLGVAGHFRAVRGLRPGVPRKPAPDAALAIAREMGVPPGEFLYLGDTATDMRTARAAGMTPVGALWGFRDRHELESAGARHLIARPEELPAIMDCRNSP